METEQKAKRKKKNRFERVRLSSGGSSQEFLMFNPSPPDPNTLLKEALEHPVVNRTESPDSFVQNLSSSPEVSEHSPDSFMQNLSSSPEVSEHSPDSLFKYQMVRSPKEMQQAAENVENLVQENNVLDGIIVSAPGSPVESDLVSAERPVPVPPVSPVPIPPVPVPPILLAALVAPIQQPVIVPAPVLPQPVVSAVEVARVDAARREGAAAARQAQIQAQAQAQMQVARQIQVATQAAIRTENLRRRAIQAAHH